MPGGGHNDIGMPEKDTRETYGYLLAEIEKANVGYIHLLRTNDEIHAMFQSKLFKPEAFFFPVFDLRYSCIHLGAARGTHYDMLDHFSHLVRNAKLFLNGGVSHLVSPLATQY